MKKLVVLAVVVMLVALGFSAATPAQAVMYGQPDGDGHPYVGLVAFYNANKVPMWRCTGALIASNLFLSAGHCTGTDPELGYGPTYAQVWLDKGPIVTAPGWTSGTSCNAGPFSGYPCSGGIWGTPHPHPGWNGYLTIPNTHDVGVVVLDTPVTNKGYAALPTAGLLDQLATKRGLQDVSFTVVGYGLQGVKPVYSAIKERMVGTVKLTNLRSSLTDGYNLHLSSNPGNWSGGTCFGDSGGPVFLNDTNTVVAVNSFVLNSNCKGAGFGFRVDTSLALDFIGGYMP